jgi:lipopolysaccharide export system protein LptC
LAEAKIDIRGGKIVSDKPVEVKSFEWLVQSNRMEITDSGDVVRFDRGVSVTIEGETALRFDAAVRTR